MRREQCAAANAKGGAFYFFFSFFLSFIFHSLHSSSARHGRWVRVRVLKCAKWSERCPFALAQLALRRRLRACACSCHPSLRRFSLSPLSSASRCCHSSLRSNRHAGWTLLACTWSDRWRGEWRQLDAPTPSLTHRLDHSRLLRPAIPQPSDQLAAFTRSVASARRHFHPLASVAVRPLQSVPLDPLLATPATATFAAPRPPLLAMVCKDCEKKLVGVIHVQKGECTPRADGRRLTPLTDRH